MIEPGFSDTPSALVSWSGPEMTEAFKQALSPLSFAELYTQQHIPDYQREAYEAYEEHKNAQARALLAEMRFNPRKGFTSGCGAPS